MLSVQIQMYIRCLWLQNANLRLIIAHHYALKSTSVLIGVHLSVHSYLSHARLKSRSQPGPSAQGAWWYDTALAPEQDTRGVMCAFTA